MRGFTARVDVPEVEAFLAEHAKALEGERVPLLECVGRVLAEAVDSEVDVPGFARSAMDGYALRGEETFGASAYDAIRLKVVGVSLPGAPYEGELRDGEAVRIMTGAPIPEAADAVVKAEVCEEADGIVSISEAVAPRKNVGAIGEDIKKGEPILSAGRRLRPQDVGLLSSMGRASVSCIRAPRVRLVVTGDELLPAGSMPSGFQIVDSNSVVLRGLIARDGDARCPSRSFRTSPRRFARRWPTIGLTSCWSRAALRSARRIMLRGCFPSLANSSSTGSRCGRRVRRGSDGSGRVWFFCCREIR